MSLLSGRLSNIYPTALLIRFILNFISEDFVLYLTNYLQYKTKSSEILVYRIQKTSEKKKTHFKRHQEKETLKNFIARKLLKWLISKDKI